MTADNWRRVQLGDVVRQVSEHERDPESVGLDRYVGLEHLDSERTLVERWGDVSDGTTFTKRFDAGQLLFAKRRAYQRKAAIADFGGVCSSDLIVMEAKPNELAPPLLPHLVHTQQFLEHALKTSSGSLSPRTRWRDLAKYEFDLPPYDRQLVIAALLDASEEQLGTTRAAQDAASELRAGVLARLLTSGWDEVAVSAVAEIRLGRQRSPDRTRGADPTPYLRAANVTGAGIDFSDVLEMDFDDREKEIFELRPNDVLLVEGNAKLTGVGLAAKYTDEMPLGVCFQNTLVRLRTIDPLRLSPEFLFATCRAMYLSGAFGAIATGTNIKHLGAKRVASLRMPLPPLPEQERLLASVRVSDGMCDELARHAYIANEQRAQLRSLLLRKSS